MIEFAGLFINPYFISHIRIESALDDVALHVTMGCGEVLIERYKSKAEAQAMITELSEIIDPTFAFKDITDEDDDDDDDDDAEEAQDFGW